MLWICMMHILAKGYRNRSRDQHIMVTIPYSLHVILGVTNSRLITNIFSHVGRDGNLVSFKKGKVLIRSKLQAYILKPLILVLVFHSYSSGLKSSNLLLCRHSYSSGLVQEIICQAYGKVFFECFFLSKNLKLKSDLMGSS